MIESAFLVCRWAGTRSHVEQVPAQRHTKPLRSTVRDSQSSVRNSQSTVRRSESTVRFF
jgi:hypothetical protein